MAILTWLQVAAVALKSGFPPGPAAIATAITQPESGRNPAIIQQGMPYSQTGWGLWQITPGNSEPQYGIDNQLLDPLRNGGAAFAKWYNAGSFRPWTTFVSGAEQFYLPDAEAAVAAVTHMSVSQVDALVGSSRGGGHLADTVPTGVANWAPVVDASARTVASQAARVHNTAIAIAALRGPWRPPVPHPPAPGTILQPVRRLPRA